MGLIYYCDLNTRINNHFPTDLSSPTLMEETFLSVLNPYKNYLSNKEDLLNQDIFLFFDGNSEYYTNANYIMDEMKKCLIHAGKSDTITVWQEIIQLKEGRDYKKSKKLYQPKEIVTRYIERYYCGKSCYNNHPTAVLFLEGDHSFLAQLIICTKPMKTCFDLDISDGPLYYKKTILDSIISDIMNKESSYIKYRGSTDQDYSNNLYSRYIDHSKINCIEFY